MMVVAKSKFDKNTYDKIRKGASAIELHLDQDFVGNPTIWDENIIRSVQIVAVHAPLIEHKSDIDIEVVANRGLLVKTCEFARRVADAQGHTVTIICHLGTDPEVLKELGVYDSLVIFMRDLATSYEQLEFAIENVTLFDHATTGSNGHVGFRPIQFDSPVRFVKDVAHPRVGTCLDTCHAMMDIALLNWIDIHLGTQRYDVCGEKAIEIEDFFRANADTIKWVHLANIKRHGLGKYHGMPFAEEDVDVLNYIMTLYKKYGYTCPITIEVKEADYSDAKNYETTQNTLMSILHSLD